MAAAAERRAQAAEATDTKITVEWRDLTFRLEPSGEWDLDVLDLLEANRVNAFLRIVFGDDQYTAFRAARPKLKDLNEIFVKVQEAAGFRPGE